MSVEAVIPALFWIVLGVVIASFLVRALSRRYPGTALAPFRSGHGIGQYFAFAREVITADKRLIRYPIYLTILDYLSLFIPSERG